MRIKVWKYFAVSLLAFLTVVVLTAAGVLVVLCGRGKQQLLAYGSERQQTVETQITYQGQSYEYKDGLINILCLGIDRGELQEAQIPGAGGQADMVMLVVLDTEAEELKVIGVPRDLMLQIDIYSRNNNYLGQERGQLALQYAYGDGRERSCELMEDTVSGIFGGIPIHGYCALGIPVIEELNDAVGGVTVTIPENDLVRLFPEYIKGRIITLHGEEARYFVRERDTEMEAPGANLYRMQRQKVYMLAYVEQLRQQMKNDPLLPLDLAEIVTGQMVSSLSNDQIIYLATHALRYGFSENQILYVAGEQQMGEVYEEFCEDQEALRQLILDVFYNPI